MRKRHKFKIESAPSDEIKLRAIGEFYREICSPILHQMNIWKDPINVYIGDSCKLAHLSMEKSNRRYFLIITFSIDSDFEFVRSQSNYLKLNYNN